MRKIIYVDMDDVLCDFSGAQREALRNCPDIKFPQCQYGFFRNLPPIEGGLDAVRYLDAVGLFSVYILTAPSVRNPLCYTEKRLWIEDHFGMGMVDKLIISPNKGLNRGDYLIDDHAAGRGQENFEGVLLQFGHTPFLDWKDILYFFRKKYKI